MPKANRCVAGLAHDALSAENAVVILHSARTPLVIDPSGQSSKWLQAHLKAKGTNYEVVPMQSDRYNPALHCFWGLKLYVEVMQAQRHADIMQSRCKLLGEGLSHCLCLHGPAIHAAFGSKLCCKQGKLMLQYVCPMQICNYPRARRALWQVPDCGGGRLH